MTSYNFDWIPSIEKLFQKQFLGQIFLKLELILFLVKLKLVVKIGRTMVNGGQTIVNSGQPMVNSGQPMVNRMPQNNRLFCYSGATVNLNNN